ncbi:MAG: Rpp14/Pop5 family protein [Candidatus Hodarchaeales archaeon]
MLKERTRYILVHFISSSPIEEKDAWFIVSNQLKKILGVLGASEIGLFLSFFDPELQSGIFHASHYTVHKVRAALCFIQKWKNDPLYVYSDGVTGTLKKAKILLNNKQKSMVYENIKESLNFDSF